MTVIVVEPRRVSRTTRVRSRELPLYTRRVSVHAALHETLMRNRPER